MRVFCIISLAASLSVTGCFFRTTYRNVSATHAPMAADTNAPATGGSWRHFFVYGWFPSEMLIPADDICKSSGGVREIRTQRTFLQALVAGVQSFFIYVPIWSPWDAEIVCADDSDTATH